MDFYEAVERIDKGEFPESVLDEIAFEYYDQWITNPGVDSSGRFYLTKEKSIKMYGKENVETFLYNLGKICRG